MTREQAELLAVHMLTHLAQAPVVLEAFLNETGLDVADLGAQSSDPDFLAGILDFFLADETLLLDFCQAENVDPSDPARARMALPGANPFY